MYVSLEAGAWPLGRESHECLVVTDAALHVHANHKLGALYGNRPSANRPHPGEMQCRRLRNVAVLQASLLWSRASVQDELGHTSIALPASLSTAFTCAARRMRTQVKCCAQLRTATASSTAQPCVCLARTAIECASVHMRRLVCLVCLDSKPPADVKHFSTTFLCRCPLQSQAAPITKTS